MLAKIAWISLIAIGSLVGLFAIYLLVVGAVPGISAPKQPVKTNRPTEKASAASLSAIRQDAGFEVHGTALHAWLYLPQNPPAPVPCIVMAHGFGGTKDMGLSPYAERFQAAGYAALAFDYRHFGASDGEPRQLLWIPGQLEDWTAAIQYARSRKEIDPGRIALWGTSMSGGHVIVTAAKDPKIACVSAQCPGLDGRKGAEIAFTRHGIGHGLRMIVHGQRDLVRSWLGLPPHKIPIFGRPGTVGCFTTADAYPAAEKLAKKGFVNEVCARINIRGDKYRPVKYTDAVKCPVLVQICEKDRLVPPVTLEESIKKLGDLAEVMRYPIGHFDIYFDKNFESAVADQLAFFMKHLL
jgi:fermentation-respiration switch protein FrsA (DUF1100 family)